MVIARVSVALAMSWPALVDGSALVQTKRRRWYALCGPEWSAPGWPSNSPASKFAEHADAADRFARDRSDFCVFTRARG